MSGPAGPALMALAGRVLLRPAAGAAGIEQHQVQEAGGTAQPMLQGYLPAERMAGHARRSKLSFCRSASASAVRFS